MTEIIYCENCNKKIKKRKGYLQCVHCSKIECTKCFNKKAKKWTRAINNKKTFEPNLMYPFDCECQK